MDINQIIRERRSHYPHEFNGQILGNDIIDTLLDNANWAPNHTLNYPWRFKVLKGDEMRAWVEQAITLYRKDTPAEKFSQKKVDKMEGYKASLSHAIAIVRQTSQEKPSSETEDICAIACAVQNMYLSLCQFPNAAGYWSTGLGTNKKSMHDYLGLTEQQHLMGFFMLGAVNSKRTESNRKDFRDFLI